MSKIKPLTDAEKRQVFEETKQLYAQYYGEDHARNGSCLYLAFTLGQVLFKRGIMPLLQAGDMTWPMAPDRGTNITHFSYIWSPTEPGSALAIKEGRLPEMHVWLGLEETGEIIDFSTGYLPEQAERMLGLKWELPPPPEFLWTDELPDGVVYTPHLDAIKLVINMRMKDLKEQGYGKVYGNP